MLLVAFSVLLAGTQAEKRSAAVIKSCSPASEMKCKQQCRILHLFADDLFQQTNTGRFVVLLQSYHQFNMKSLTTEIFGLELIAHARRASQQGVNLEEKNICWNTLSSSLSTSMRHDLFILDTFIIVIIWCNSVQLLQSLLTVSCFKDV